MFYLGCFIGLAVGFLLGWISLALLLGRGYQGPID